MPFDSFIFGRLPLNRDLIGGGVQCATTNEINVNK